MMSLLYTALAFILVAIFLPLPLYWLILHRNISYFRRHKMHLIILLIILVGGAAGLAYNYIQEIGLVLPFHWAIRLVGLGLLVICLWMTFHTFREGGFRTMMGISEIKEEKKLVEKGLYKHIRHPKYLEWLLFLLSVFLVSGLQAMAFIFVYSLAMFYMLTFEEEKELERRVPDYGKYKQRTGRFLPKIGRSEPKIESKERQETKKTIHAKLITRAKVKPRLKPRLKIKHTAKKHRS